MGELYVQTTGTSDREGYLRVASRERFEVGELWTMGKFYGALSISQEILPILVVSASTIVNFLDPSALIGPGLTWSVASNAELTSGGFIALGRKPAELEVTDLLDSETFQPLEEDELLDVIATGSELGLAPSQAYAQLKFYF